MHLDVVIIGLPCAGKTTAGSILRRDFGYDHIEASAFMRQLFRVTAPGCSLAEFAATVLLEDPAFVPRSVLASRSLGCMNDKPLALTGLRSPAEIEHLRLSCPSNREILVVVLQAPQEIRFARSLQRQRGGDPPTLTDFVTADQEQLAMGLSKLMSDARAYHIMNAGSLEGLQSRLQDEVARPSVPT